METRQMTDAELVDKVRRWASSTKENEINIAWIRRVCTLAASALTPRSEIETRWIPLAKRMPETGVPVLCWCVDSIVSTGYWTGHSWVLDVNSDYDPHTHPTHWMPAPEAPNGK